MQSGDQRIFRLEKKHLRRVLGSWDLFAVGYGDIGSSIYYALGATALYALGATPLALLAAGFVFICTAFSYAEMSATFPEPGGSATFSRYAFNDFVSFVAGWGLLLDYIVTIAISAFAIPPYLRSLINLAGIPYDNTPVFHIGFTVVIIGLLFVVNYFGVKESGRLSLILAIFTIITQFAIIAIGGFLFLNLPLIISHLKINVANANWSPDWWSFAKGCSAAMVAYTGVEAIAQLAAEVKQPARSIQHAIKWTVAVVLFLYMGLSTIGLSVLTPFELGTTYLENPVLGIAENFPIGADWLGPWVGLTAAIVLLIAANAGLVGCSRLVFSMGEYYQVPSFCYKIHPKYQTPYITLILFAILSAVVVICSGGHMLFLVDIYNFGAQMAFFFVHMALLVLRWKYPDLERPYKAPFNIPFGKGRYLPLTAIIGALVSLAIWLLVVATKWEGRILGFSWVGVGILFFYLYRRKTKLTVFGKTHIETIKISKYKPMILHHILVAIRGAEETHMLETAFQLAKQHNALVTVTYILEIPHTLPIDGGIPKKEKVAEFALQVAEALGLEFNIHPTLKLVRARAFDPALVDLASTEGVDLIITGAYHADLQKNHLLNQTENLLKESRCPVLFYRF